MFAYLPDIEPKSTTSARAEKPLWTRSDNTFRFNFLSDSSPAPAKETPPSSDKTEQAPSQVSFTGQGSFSFNFQIPPSSPVEDMDATETPDTSSKSTQEEKPSPSQEVKSAPEPSQAKKKKNKKKPANKKPADGAEKQPKPSSAEGSQGGEESALVSVKLCL